MKRLIFAIAGLSMVLALTACSDDNNPSSSASPTDPQVETQKVDRTEETTAKISENDFCRMDSLGRVAQTLNFDYEDLEDSEQEWAQWVRTAQPGEEELVVGSWKVDDEYLTITSHDGESAKYHLVFTEERGILTTMTMIPVEGTEIEGVYEVCGAREKVEEQKELVQKQLDNIEEFHAKHGM